MLFLDADLSAAPLCPDPPRPGRLVHWFGFLD